MAADIERDTKHEEDLTVMEFSGDNSSNKSPSKGDVSTTLYVDLATERALVRKLDFYLLPVLAIMYFCRFTTGGNIANAKVNITHWSPCIPTQQKLGC